MSTAPVITIFVRHSEDCKYAGDEFSKRCPCRKHLRWSQSGTQHRRKAGTRSWAEAERIKRELEDQLAGRPSTIEAKDTAHYLRDAISVFLQDKQVQGITADVVAKYSRELDRLREHFERLGVYTVEGITRELLTGYCATWESLYHSSQTRAAVRTRCRGFLRYCYDAQWIPRIPPLPKIHVDEAPTMPLDAAEYSRLLKAATKFQAPPPSQHVHALIQLMRWSGLAIRDALTLTRAHIKNTGGFYRVVTARQKTGVDVSIPLQKEIALEILSVQNDGPYIFWDGKSDIVKSWTKYVMAPLFETAKIERGGNMMSHRLRDTFAVDLLEKGVPLEEVSKLLGHESIKTTERSYGKWVKARQARLDALVAATWRKAKPSKTRVG
jgi:integrase/recombinase XerD